MRYRVIAVVAAAVALSVVVATATASSKTAQAKTLTVWLQVDAQNGWAGVVANANKAFEKLAFGLERQRAVPELGRSPAEVRRDDRRERDA